MVPPPQDDAAGFTLVEVTIAMVIIAILMATAIVLFSSGKGAAQNKRSLAQMEQVRTVLERARDRQQQQLTGIFGGGSKGACAQNPLPPVAMLPGGCRAAWDAVNAKLAPLLGGIAGTPGSVAAAAELMTDGAGRPILVQFTAGCNAVGDTILADDAKGTAASPKPQLALPLPASNAGC